MPVFPPTRYSVIERLRTPGDAIQAPGVPEAEDFFQREFVRALFDRAVTALRQDCVARGREIHWRLFERCDLRRDGHPSYADLAAAFDLTRAR